MTTKQAQGKKLKNTQKETKAKPTGLTCKNCSYECAYNWVPLWYINAAQLQYNSTNRTTCQHPSVHLPGGMTVHTHTVLNAHQMHK